MTLFIILEGQQGAGKSFIAKRLKKELEEKNYLVTFFDEESIIDSCFVDGTLRVYDLFGIREQEYLQMIQENDVILVEKSFITNVIYHLQNMPDNLITEFVEFELGHYYNDNSTCQIYTLFRKYDDPIVDAFLNVSHYLLETYEIDINCLPNSQDDKTEDLINHILTRIEWEFD